MRISARKNFMKISNSFLQLAIHKNKISNAREKDEMFEQRKIKKINTKEMVLRENLGN